MKTVMVFAGQGAQTVGMGRDLAEAYPACRALFEKADAVLGYALSKICFEGPAEDLTASNHCQPAIFVTSMACYEAFRLERSGLGFEAAAGLSLGEWTALHAAGVLSFEDTLRVLEARGRFMQEACEQNAGGMVSVIGLPMEALETICRETGVTIANLNSPAQTVLSGPVDAVEAAARLAEEGGAKRAIVLKVAGAFHSPLMAPAAERLAAFLDGVTFHEPRVPVVANVTGEPHAGADAIRATMVRQVTGSVRWQASVEWFRGQGADTYIEFGPGRVLTGLIKRIDSGASLHNIHDTESLRRTVDALAQG
jgi:[acyl-carrier-protein] S-malonyltransferase